MRGPFLRKRLVAGFAFEQALEFTDFGHGHSRNTSEDFNAKAPGCKAATVSKLLDRSYDVTIWLFEPLRH